MKMREEGMSLSATAQVVGASVPAVSKWSKKGDFIAKYAKYANVMN